MEKQIGIASPGASKREAPQAQVRGSKAYRDKIHRESKFADAHKNLPFTFSKPKKDLPINTEAMCEHCGKDVLVSKRTYSWICRGCNRLAHVKKETF